MMRNFLLLIGFFTISFILIGARPTQAAEGDTYNFSWLDPDKEVYVLQNRKYRKKSKFHLNLGYGITTSGAFVDARSIQIRAGYFFTEEWGFEVIYAINSGEENDTAAAVRNNNNNLSGSTPFRRITDNYLGAMIQWSPFYAKINTFNKIIYVDWIIGLGIAKIEETNNREEVVQNRVDENLRKTTETHTGLMWDMALKFYLNESWDIRAGLTTIHYKAQQATLEAKEDWYSNWDASLAIGFNF